MKIEDIKVDDLITSYHKLHFYLRYILNPKNTEDRQLAIKAMELYVKQYVMPALYLATPCEYASDRESLCVHLEEIVGRKFNESSMRLQVDFGREDIANPNDKEVAKIESFFSEAPTSGMIDDFWTACLANEARDNISHLTLFLESPLVTSVKRQIEPSVLQNEIQQLQKLLKFSMNLHDDGIKLLISWQRKIIETGEDLSSLEGKSHHDCVLFETEREVRRSIVERFPQFAKLVPNFICMDDSNTKAIINAIIPHGLKIDNFLAWETALVKSPWFGGFLKRTADNNKVLFFLKIPALWVLVEDASPVKKELIEYLASKLSSWKKRCQVVIGKEEGFEVPFDLAEDFDAVK